MFEISRRNVRFGILNGSLGGTANVNVEGLGRFRGDWYCSRTVASSSYPQSRVILFESVGSCVSKEVSTLNLDVRPDVGAKYV